MKVTNQMLSNAAPAFQEISQLRLPAKAAYRIAKALRKINTAATTYDETRRKLLLEHVERNEKGDPIVMNGNAVVKDPLGFEKIIKDLLAEENEIDIMPISLNDLGDQVVSTGALADLDWFIVEEKNA